MPEIKLLDEIVANQIAAGEVVDRPSSVIKELVENALDAGAKAISIFCDDGGRNITVVDDGCGMSAADALLCFSRYATSKISKINDLDSLGTFGFRGEALSSIASVAKVNLITRKSDESLATQVSQSGGKLIESGSAGGSYGTRIEIRDLFFNVPARRKFLKSDRAEVSAIASIIQYLALANPLVTFNLTVDNKKATEFIGVSPDDTIHSPAQIDRAISILGSETGKYIYPFEDSTRYLQISGYVVAPLITRRDYKGIVLFVNGRFVQDRQLSNAVKVAFRSLLEVGRNPICALNFSIDPASIDVNVHPQKLEVRFSEGAQICSEIIRSLSRFLSSTPWVKRNPSYQPALSQAAYEFPQNDPFTLSQSEFINTGNTPSFYSAPRVSPFPVVAQEAVPQPKLGTQMGINNNRKFTDLKIVGQVGNTFLVLEGEAEMIVVDQHAAHERILFEKFKERSKNAHVHIQPLLIPLQLSLGASEIAALNEYGHRFIEFGIEVKLFGDRQAIVTSLPKDLPVNQASELILDFLSDLSGHGRSDAWDEFSHKMLASMACHSAIRAGQALQPEEISALLTQLENIDYSAHCPHGRPLVRSVPMKEIARWFDRP